MVHPGYPLPLSKEAVMKKLVGSLGTQARVALFAVGLAAVFSASFAVGSVVEPADTDGEEMEMGGHAEAGGHAESGEHAGQEAAGATTGLAISEGGYSLRLAPAFVEVGEPRQLSFQIEAPDGEPVHRFDRLHEREMHLIVVRRDGSHFQHLHPELDASGTWTVSVELPAAGVYRGFADFAVGGEDHTLATDVFAAGEFEPRPFPAPSAVDETAGYELRLADASIEAGRSSALEFAVTRNGAEVTDLEDYLGAKGHLVALREGDLAFLHVHPDEAIAPNTIPFGAHFPTAGNYRLFLQFKHDRRVRTAEFTVEVQR